MTPDQLELAITHHLDGTLPPVMPDELRRIIAADSKARALLDEHERLTALLRSQPLPDLDFVELARDFSAVVTGTVDDASHAQDQKLNAVLKSLPPIPAIRWDRLGAQISGALDAELAAADQADQQLDALLHADPPPALNWDRLAGQISRSIAIETGAPIEQAPAASPAGGDDAKNNIIRNNTGGTPVPPRAGDNGKNKVIRINWVRRFSQLAIAACLVGAAAVGLQIYQHRAQNNPPRVAVNPTPAPAPLAIVQVSSPQAEKSSQPAIAEISIGPSKAYAAASDEEFYRRGVASRAPVVIAVPIGNDDDADRALGFD